MPTLHPQADAHWVMAIPVLSTSHIRQQTHAWLQINVGGWIALEYAEYSHGFFIALGESDSDPAEWFPDHPDLQHIASWVKSNCPAATWMRLDADGDVIDALPSYDWEEGDRDSQAATGSTVPSESLAILVVISGGEVEGVYASQGDCEVKIVDLDDADDDAEYFPLSGFADQTAFAAYRDQLHCVR
ncbi:hypothetical protein [Chromobacterium violaceum]|uniref:DUF5983 domain-containing protein n=1 Tax=Chromobacterium violaceum (strain ATCC 12472 / DSM 30191 / JCM 1249 / CCUG 213 / NBRC 12614 / NCIMB 9131 / NCTC 9757 / MK) TaxID=243365 RepID=Q7NYQ9_CHRVO|nr:hypothetical protein [Chromobacterium violaceum]AAQ58889.1 hypothetical protein CV_1214 [Chromobacterium violaceum ATCC 12472]SUX88935.1 Uncharacterised protein [Chromobacterium violaceum]